VDNWITATSFLRIEREKKGKDKVGRPQQQGYEDKDCLKKLSVIVKFLISPKRKSVWNMGNANIQLDLQVR
jgi:hypothetical protein